MNKAVFLDRDGTIAIDVPYCSKPEDFILFPDTAEAIRLLKSCGFFVILITNQSGIARGIISEESLASIHQKLEKELFRQGTSLDAIYFCPHHPDDNCKCRKPQTGMFTTAARDLNIDFTGSFVVGDKNTDIMAGKALGCRTVLVCTQYNQRKDTRDIPDYVASSIMDAAKWIIMNNTMLDYGP